MMQGPERLTETWPPLSQESYFCITSHRFLPTHKISESFEQSRHSADYVAEPVHIQVVSVPRLRSQRWLNDS